MNRQDRQGVRTPQDIERKYDLASIVGLKRAVENSLTGLNKTNTILEEFIKATIGSVENMENQLDGNITTWFYGGVPTLSNAPAVDWETDEQKAEHIGDWYYDMDTGRVYKFSSSDGTYLWEENESNAIIGVMALANSAKDTADGKRRVFTTEPVPPYDNGDLWFHEKEIYICQISKGDGEAYEENDFIIATRYTDDTAANKVGENLEVLRGTVLKVIESADQLRSEVMNLDTGRGRQIDTLTDEVTIKFGKIADDIEAAKNDLQNQLNVINKYFVFDEDGLSIGQTDSPFKVVLDNDLYTMLVNGVAALLLDPDGKSIIPELSVTKAFNLFDYLIDQDSSGNVNCGYVGE